MADTPNEAPGELDEARRDLRARLETLVPDAAARDRAADDANLVLRALVSGDPKAFESLDARRLRDAAAQLGCQLLEARLDNRTIIDLLADPSWRDLYAEVAADPRVEGATTDEVFRWALLRAQGGDRLYEQTVNKRSSGPV